jgi:hypothetical protein
MKVQTAVPEMLCVVVCNDIRKFVVNKTDKAYVKLLPDLTDSMRGIS